MNFKGIHRLGDLQLQILKVLWARKEAAVTDVHAVIHVQPALAYTTIATMLRKMEQRGLVTHRLEGRTFIYRAAVTEDQVERGMAEHVLDRVFNGRLADLVSDLLREREVDAEELERLSRVISDRRKRP
ncbi:MAG TPA: BlaI/MecI/CopY family transcriptional regulator [Candidatus Paceibacterota bacterium]|nr:BlaI/MecI/CopY family transcriptional regulator [Verrucomicrobiota bacterium]HRY49966.1 BlaI/MecI/CopY family transcriptional regulator [Candidatus Paceibacterota bacterium]HSA01633.1 BlaI/MecI/CopY family transcriptional regulator [Candidatus Paceibacterota bacterium]